MTKSLKPSLSKETKPRGRSGGRKPTVLEDDRKEQANVWLPRWINRAVRELVPAASDRNNLFASWARAYVINKGESDRLLGQSPLAAELLDYLEARDAPEHLRDWLKSLIVQRASGEDRLITGVIKTKNGAS